MLTAQIVDVARASFAEKGYAGTSMRAVARAAGVDPRLIGYYFTSKAELLEACLLPPPGFLESVARVARGRLEQRGEALVRALLAAWEDQASAAVLRSILLTAAHEKVAADRLALIVRGGLAGAVAGALEDGQRLLRGGLVASQMIGLAMTRYVWKIEPLASMPDEEVVELIAPTIQRYLAGTLR